MPRRDPDKPSTWARYKTGMCKNCWAGCCTMPVEVSSADLIQMGLSDEEEAAGSLKKLAKRLETAGIVKTFRTATGVFILSQRPNNDCYFLDSKTRLCTIYEKRPNVCRQFPFIGARPGYCPTGEK
jgi:Fe-S-cluster containining protein